MSHIALKINNLDNVAIAINTIPSGTKIDTHITALQDIPQGHKIALCDIPKDQAIVRYGVVIGYAIEAIQQGAWIHEGLVRLPSPPKLDDMISNVNIVTSLPPGPRYHI